MKRRSAYGRKVKIRVAFQMNTFGSRTGRREKMSRYVKSGQASRTYGENRYYDAPSELSCLRGKGQALTDLHR